MPTLEGSLREAAESFPNLSKMYDVYLESEKLGICTRVDCILIDESKKQAWPLQVKWARKPRKIFLSHKLQLLLEAVLIEEQFGYRVLSGFIKFLKTGDIFEIELKKRIRLWNSIYVISKILSNEYFPEPTKFEKRCIDCCYRSKCWCQL